MLLLAASLWCTAWAYWSRHMSRRIVGGRPVVARQASPRVLPAPQSGFPASQVNIPARVQNSNPLIGADTQQLQASQVGIPTRIL